VLVTGAPAINAFYVIILRCIDALPVRLRDAQ